MIRATGSSLRIFPAFGYFYSIKFPGKIIWIARTDVSEARRAHARSVSPK
jgi:hypothetical protein